jgi:hypothetical protein
VRDSILIYVNGKKQLISGEKAFLSVAEFLRNAYRAINGLFCEGVAGE